MAHRSRPVSLRPALHLGQRERPPVESHFVELTLKWPPTCRVQSCHAPDTAGQLTRVPLKVAGPKTVVRLTACPFTQICAVPATVSTAAATCCHWSKVITLRGRAERGAGHGGVGGGPDVSTESAVLVSATRTLRSRKDRAGQPEPGFRPPRGRFASDPGVQVALVLRPSSTGESGCSHSHPPVKDKGLLADTEPESSTPL